MAKKENDKPVDRFTQLRRQISDELKGLREFDDYLRRWLSKLCRKLIAHQMLEHGQDAKTAAKSAGIRDVVRSVASVGFKISYILFS